MIDTRNGAVNQRLACAVTELTSQGANTVIEHIKGLREEIQDLEYYGRP